MRKLEHTFAVGPVGASGSGLRAVIRCQKASMHFPCAQLTSGLIEDLGRTIEQQITATRSQKLELYAGGTIMRLTKEVEIELGFRLRELIDKTQAEQFVVLDRFLGIFHPKHCVIKLPF